MGAWTTPCFLDSTGGVDCAYSEPYEDHVLDNDVPPVVSLTAGNWELCGLHANGSASCWDGEGARFDLNDDLTDAVALAGGWPSCALHADGHVSCVGGGPEPGPPRAERWVVPRLADVIAIDASTHDFACAITAQRRVACWGANGLRQLGVTSLGPEDRRDIPVEVPGLENIVKIALGGEHACALDNEGVVRCWGHNNQSQLGEFGL